MLAQKAGKCCHGVPREQLPKKHAGENVTIPKVSSDSTPKMV
jgi:hypothetical protein